MRRDHDDEDQIVVLKAELAVLEAELARVRALGEECVVWITGDPSNASEIKTTTDALGAMREAFLLGQKRNDEAKQARAVIRGLLEIAKIAMPDSYFESDRRVRAAQRLLND